MFSATMQPAIEDVVKNVMSNDPLKVTIGIRNATSKSVSTKLVYTGNESNKLRTLRQEIEDSFQPPMLIFVQSKDRAK
jgi:ATP-dependent RNA helicase DDX52/ROK1